MSPPNGTRPVFYYAPTVFQEAVEAVEAFLAARGDVFARSGELVRVCGGDDDWVEQSVWWDAEGNKHFGIRPAPKRIVTMTGAVLRALVSESIDFRWRKGASQEWQPILPPYAVIATLRAAGWWENISPLLGISRLPVVRPDGTVARVRGYDRPSKYYLDIPFAHEHATQVVAIAGAR